MASDPNFRDAYANTYLTRRAGGSNATYIAPQASGTYKTTRQKYQTNQLADFAKMLNPVSESQRALEDLYLKRAQGQETLRAQYQP